jgi:HB1, ASXL, restriction endonuclease HTH domain
MSPDMNHIRVGVGSFMNPAYVSHPLVWRTAMKANDVKIKNVYVAKVTKKMVPVRIDGKHPDGGWKGTNLKTQKQVHIKTAERLIKPAKDSAAKARVPKKKTVPKPAAESGQASKGPQKAGSALDGAVRVLTEAKGGPLGCGQMVEQMLEKGYWQTDGKTPAATLYSAILREIKQKGKAARFRKTDRGVFTLNK